MKKYQFLFSLILCNIAINTYAHVRWDVEGPIVPRDFGSRTSCPEQTDSPTLLRAGSSLTVTYEVLILHGAPIRIDFSPADDLGFSNHILSSLTETAGKTTTTIQLPDILCDACTLRVHGGGYMSCADIQLTETGLPEPDPADTSPPSDISNLTSEEASNQISLSWSNPTEDYYKTLALLSDADITDTPTNGMSYEAGDAFSIADVIYTGMNSTTAATNLTPSTTYYFKIFTYDQSLNYSDGVSFDASTTANINAAPTITLNVMQDTVIGTSIDTDKGLVMVQAIVEDPDTEDTHQYDWSNTDNRLSDIDNEESIFSFHPEQLADGDYTLQVRVVDDGLPLNEVIQTITVNISSAPAQTTTPDSTPGTTLNPTSASSGGGSLPFSTILFCLMLSLMVRTKKST